MSADSSSIDLIVGVGVLVVAILSSAGAIIAVVNKRFDAFELRLSNLENRRVESIKHDADSATSAAVQFARLWGELASLKGDIGRVRATLARIEAHQDHPRKDDDYA